jgi:crotonobetainyl-CoA:carnitine CoA-transferase CaiB-like acyl-CoA transferase
LLETNEVPYAPAYDSDEALEDPQALHLQIAVTVPNAEMGDFTTVRPPYSFDGEPEFAVSPPPRLDEHGAEIRAEVMKASHQVR